MFTPRPPKFKTWAGYLADIQPWTVNQLLHASVFSVMKCGQLKKKTFLRLVRIKLANPQSVYSSV